MVSDILLAATGNSSIPVSQKVLTMEFMGDQSW